jgi:hypothetical protein
MVPAHATIAVGAVSTARNRAQRQRVHEHASHPLVILPRFHASCVFNLLSFYEKDVSLEDSLCLKWSWEDDWFCGMKQHSCRVQSQGSLALYGSLS